MGELKFPNQPEMEKKEQEKGEIKDFRHVFLWYKYSIT
jgi:hypothetical protein